MRQQKIVFVALNAAQPTPSEIYYPKSWNAKRFSFRECSPSIVSASIHFYFLHFFVVAEMKNEIERKTNGGREDKRKMKMEMENDKSLNGKSLLLGDIDAIRQLWIYVVHLWMWFIQMSRIHSSRLDAMCVHLVKWFILIIRCNWWILKTIHFPNSDTQRNVRPDEGTHSLESEISSRKKNRIESMGIYELGHRVRTGADAKLKMSVFEDDKSKSIVKWI